MMLQLLKILMNKYMEEEKNEEIIAEKPKLRQIIIETDGNMVKLIKAEVAGNLEMSAILKVILSKIEE